MRYETRKSTVRKYQECLSVTLMLMNITKTLNFIQST